MTRAEIDALALKAALERPVMMAKFIGNALNGIVSAVDGADAAQQQAEQQYQNAADQSNKAYTGAEGTSQAAYDAALQKLLTGANGGSAQTFAADTAQSLQPQFDVQNRNLTAREAALGITNSGAAAADFGQLTADQSATLAGAVAPLYASEQGAYDSLIGEQAGAQTSLAAGAAGAASGDYGAGASAGNQAYQSTNAQFYQALEAAAGAPSLGGGSASGGGAVALAPASYATPAAPGLGTMYDAVGPYAAAGSASPSSRSFGDQYLTNVNAQGPGATANPYG